LAINNHSNIRSETNYKGLWLDAQAFTESKANIEHSVEPQSERAWAQSYVAPEVLFQEDTVPVEPDPKLEEAITRDLKIRNIH
jgi:hypothetical protein